MIGNNNFNSSSYCYWASAGKTLTAMLTGIAQQEGFLSIQDKTSEYLGENWTSLNADKENLITIRHQLTMTTGLDDGVADNQDFSAENLLYKANAGTRWAYHNAPSDLIAGLRKNGQFVSVVPSLNLVMVRMGESPDDVQVPFLFHDQIWQKLKLIVK